MSGPRQQITGLSKDATLDRERESGEHRHIIVLDVSNENTAMSHGPTPQTHPAE